MISNIQMPSTESTTPSNSTSLPKSSRCFVLFFCCPRIVSHEDKNVEHLAEPHQRLHHQSLQVMNFAAFCWKWTWDQKPRNTNEKPKQHNSFCFDATFLFLEFRSWSIMIVGNLFSLILSYHKVQRETLRIPTRKDIHQTLLHMRHAWLYW